MRRQPAVMPKAAAPHIKTRRGRLAGLEASDEAKRLVAGWNARAHLAKARDMDSEMRRSGKFGPV
jgi:hypothetical protein